MFSLFPNSEAPFAGWAIHHAEWLVIVAAAIALCGWTILRQTGRDRRRADGGDGGGGDFGGSSSSDGIADCSDSGGGDCGGGGDGGGGD